MMRHTSAPETAAGGAHTERSSIDARRPGMVAAGFWHDRTLLDDFDARIRDRPHDPAIVAHAVASGTRTRLTYAGLGERVDRIAVGLAGLGVEHGDVVSYQLPNWWEFVALHLACLRIGAVTNPIMPIMRQRELEYMLNHARSKVMVTPATFRDFDYAAMIAGMRSVLPHLKHALVVGGSGDTAFERLYAEPVACGARDDLFAARRPAPDDVIQVLYTSGTTGAPKGVMHTSNTLISNIVPYRECLHLSQSDTVFMASPLAHQTGFIYGVMMPIHLGAPAVLQDVWSSAVAADLFAQEQPTFTMASTPFLADLTDAAERRPEAFRALRVFVSAGAPIPRVLVRRATEHLGANIVSGWGMTENGAVTITRPGDAPEKVFETDGAALPGMEIRTVDVNGRALAAGEEGYLQVRGCSNFAGYLNRPDLVTFNSEGWFDTGDLARIDAEGYVRITGRSKDIIIRGGENIPVVEIEGLLYRHPAVQDVAIVAMPDPRLGERACAFVTARAGASLSLADVVAYLAGHQVSKTYLPEHLEVVAEMPRTPSGKIQKFRLREMARSLRPVDR